MWRIVVVSALVVVLASAAPSPVCAKGKTAPRCTEYPSFRVEICSELDVRQLDGIGSSTTWAVRVRGARKPVEIRLHNHSPAVVRLEGGDDQVVRLGGLRNREIQLKVTAVGPGTSGLTAKPRDPSPESEAATLAADIAPLLARIEADFTQRRSRLLRPPSLPAVLDLLNTTEAALLGAFNYQELGALRDYVREELRRAREDLEKTGAGARSAALHSVPSGAVLTSLAVLQPRGTVLEETTDSVLDRVGDLIHRLYEMATANDMITTLCVVSAPGSKARFLMRPRSYSESLETSTVGSISGIYRGLYVYSISKGRAKVACEDPDVEKCAPINLIDDPSPILHCDLDARACKRMQGPLPEPCRGTRP